MKGSLGHGSLNRMVGVAAKSFGSVIRQRECRVDRACLVEICRQQARSIAADGCLGMLFGYWRRSSGVAIRVANGKKKVWMFAWSVWSRCKVGCCCAFSRPTSCGSRGRPAPWWRCAETAVFRAARGGNEGGARQESVVMLVMQRACVACW